MIYTLFVIFIVIASLLMIGIVLIQESKGGGLASNFSSSNAILGVRKTTDFVEKATWVSDQAHTLPGMTACIHLFFQEQLPEKR
jgi:protein translocase SecG subunit